MAHSSLRGPFDCTLLIRIQEFARQDLGHFLAQNATLSTALRATSNYSPDGQHQLFQLRPMYSGISYVWELRVKKREIFFFGIAKTFEIPTAFRGLTETTRRPQ